MFKLDLKEFALQIVNNWFSIRKSMYFILIKDIYFCNKQKEIMIKYQCSNKRIGDTITLIEFMQSPLKHATYPDQIMQIGIHLERELNRIRTCGNSSDTTNLRRFKQVFYKDEI